MKRPTYKFAEYIYSVCEWIWIRLLKDKSHHFHVDELGNNQREILDIWNELKEIGK